MKTPATLRLCLLVAAAFALRLSFAPTPLAGAADLTVDGSSGNGFYVFPGTAVYDNIYVGETTFGQASQTGSGDGFVVIAIHQLIIGDKQGSTGIYNLTGTAGAKAMVLQAGDALVIGNYGNGTFNQGVNSKVATNQLIFQQSFPQQVSVYNLNGGALYAGMIGVGNNFFASGNTAEMNFNGGQVNAQTDNATFFQGLSAAYVRNGGVAFGGSNATIAQPLLHSNKAGDNATDGGVTKVDAQTLTLTGANTYTGPTALNGGVLNAGSATALGNGGAITFGGGTLQYSAASAGVDFSARFGTAAGQAVNLDTNGQNATIGFGFGGGGTSLTKLGAGTLTINGGNAYTGATNLNAGTVVANNPGALGSGGVITFGGGTLQYGDTSHTDAQYNAADFSARFSTGGGQRYQIDTNGHNINYATGLTSRGGTLTKLGTGTLALNGANTYDGLTNVSAGTLLLNGTNTGGGNLFVDGSGSPVLGGTGSTLSMVNVKNGTLSPGGNGGAAGSAANVGNLRVGSLALTSGSLASFDVNSATVYDVLTSSDRVTLGGSALNLDINPNATFTAGQTLDLIHLTGGTLGGTFAGIVNGNVYTFGSQLFQAEYTATDFELVAVPEPATWVGGAAAGLLAARAWRRRKG